jgi:hypothetical protein
MGLSVGSKGLLAEELICIDTPETDSNERVVECIDMMSFVQRIGTFDGTTHDFCRRLFLCKIPSLCQPGTLKIACFDDNRLVPAEKAECQKKRSVASNRDTGQEAYIDIGFVLVDDDGLLYANGTRQAFSPIRLLKSRWLRPHLYEYMLIWLVNHTHEVMQVCGRSVFDFGSNGLLVIQPNKALFSDPIARLQNGRVYDAGPFNRLTESPPTATFFTSNQSSCCVYGEAEVACFAWALSYRPWVETVRILSGDFDCIGIGLSLAPRFTTVSLKIIIWTAQNVFCSHYLPTPAEPTPAETTLGVRASRLSLLVIILPGTDFIQKKLVFHRLRSSNIKKACLYAWDHSTSKEIDVNMLQLIICAAYHFQHFPTHPVTAGLNMDAMRSRLVDKKTGTDIFPNEANVSKYITQVLFNVRYWNNICPRVGNE